MTNLIGKQFKNFCLVSLVFMALLTGTACEPDPDTAMDPFQDDQLEEEEPANDEASIEDPELEDTVDADKETDPLISSDYYWPLLSHGQLTLSSGEIIDGPSILESDSGFVAEFTKDYEYNGLVIWLVEKSDVFAIEWLNLSFDVGYYSGSENIFDLRFNLDVENLAPEPGEKGLQEFNVDLVEEKEGFRITIDRVILAKEQESRVTTEPVDYVALDIEINVVDKP